VAFEEWMEGVVHAFEVAGVGRPGGRIPRRAVWRHKGHGAGRENLGVFDVTLGDDAMARIEAMDTDRSQFFDHRDPAMVSRLSNVRVD
jgi:hypothetical protein